MKILEIFKSLLPKRKSVEQPPVRKDEKVLTFDSKTGELIVKDKNEHQNSDISCEQIYKDGFMCLPQ